MTPKKPTRPAAAVTNAPPTGSVSAFMERHFRHFNARETLEAARAYKAHLASGGKMLLAMAGAMSTAEIGTILARMIRADKIHAVSCTAANLEEDIYNLIGHDDYRQIPNYRELTIEQEARILRDGYSRVTDTAIPERTFKLIDEAFLEVCRKADADGEQYFPYEYFYQILDSGVLEPYYHISPRDSWVVAAREKNIPIYTPGWEDSTTGNTFAAWVAQKKTGRHAVRPGTEQMEHLINWYIENDRTSSLGFFQIGGGIAGDFAICAVPTIIIDMKIKIRLWGYFAQISDSVTSYGSYSGAVPTEKISWMKLDPSTPRFMINSDATVVAPLIFAYVLGD